MQHRGRTAELKIMMVLAYFLVFLVVVHCRNALFAAQRDSFREAVTSYFVCEAVGYVPGKCSREALEQFIHPLLGITVDVMLFFLPVSFLVFVINFRIVREQVEKLSLILSLKSQSSSNV